VQGYFVRQGENVTVVLASISEEGRERPVRMLVVTVGYPIPNLLEMGPSYHLTDVPNPKKNGVYDSNAGVDYNLTLCPLQSRLQHMYLGSTYTCT
jgi:hypothetical protein